MGKETRFNFVDTLDTEKQIGQIYCRQSFGKVTNDSNQIVDYYFVICRVYNESTSGTLVKVLSVTTEQDYN